MYVINVFLLSSPEVPGIEGEKLSKKNNKPDSVYRYISI